MHFADIRSKNQISADRDILRIPEKYQKYRYAKISQLLETGQFCRYVYSIWTFENPTLLQISNKISEIIFLAARL